MINATMTSIVSFAILIFSTAAQSSDNECTLEYLNNNISVEAEVRPRSQGDLVVQSNDPKKFLTVGKLVPCTIADLLKLGFDHRGRTRYGPNDSTNGAFEEISVLQKGQLVVSCYLEFDLTERSKSAKVAWSRAACGQTVQPRLSDR